MRKVISVAAVVVKASVSVAGCQGMGSIQH
jgi:predicted small secreted protein